MIASGLDVFLGPALTGHSRATGDRRGFFRLGFGGAISERLSTNSSTEEVKVALEGIFEDDDRVSVEVSESTQHSGGDGVAWRVVFLSHLEVRDVLTLPVPQ